MLNEMVHAPGDVLPADPFAVPGVVWSFREDQRISFDRVGLLAALASFPVPRSPGQDRYCGTWGRVRVPHGFLGETHTVEGGSGLGWREGRTFRVSFGPGVGQLASFDATRRERAEDRLRVAAAKTVDIEVAFKLAGGVTAETGASGREVTCWSSKSRARMVKAFASVDWAAASRCYCGRLFCDSAGAGVPCCDIASPMPLAMLTLTYPNDWVRLAPTGQASKRHLALFRQRWSRALGWRLDGAWKLEFQRPRECGESCGQRAPHYHLLVPVPALVRGVLFADWLLSTWADVVGAVGEDRAKHELRGTSVDFSKTAKMSDPRRCAVYFLKHGTKSFDDKEYQHIVPLVWQARGSGPGRFWGFWGLRPATVAVDLDCGDFLAARRVLRHVAAARARSIAFSRVMAVADEARLSPGARARMVRLGLVSAAAAARKIRTLGAGGQLSGGFVVVNDGVRLAEQVARAVALRRDVERGWGNGEGLPE